MQKVCKDLEEEFKGQKVMYIQADFDNLQTLDDYQTAIADKLSTIDIAMLFLNAGSQ